MDKSRAQKKRRWVRFSLKSLLILMVFCAICLTIGTRYWNKMVARQQFLNSVTGGDGYNSIDTEPGWASENLPEAVLARLNKLADGSTWSQRISEIWLLNTTAIDDDDLRKLHLFPELERLGLNVGAVSNGALVHSITDNGLKHLTGSKQLKELTINLNPHVTNDGMRHVSNVTSLEHLEISMTMVGDEGLIHLRKLSNLTSLNLDHTGVSDAGMADLSGFSKLKFLSLSYTSITNDGLAHLRGMHSLEFLKIRNTRLTDAGLIHLKGLRKLGDIDLQGTQVTQSGAEMLRPYLPGCKIQLDSGTLDFTQNEFPVVE